jgi:hypothetical protein
MVILVLGAPAARAGVKPAVAVSTAVPTEMTLTCDTLEYSPGNAALSAQGHAVLLSSGARVEADSLLIRSEEHHVEARGHVYLEDQGLSILADEITYNWDSSTGTLRRAYLENPPWRLWAREMTRLGPDTYRLNHAAFTTCDRNPPHYHFRGTRGKLRLKKRATVWNARFALGSDPVLYTPVYSHGFSDRRWTLTVDPGYSARNGATAKTVFTYPTDATRARLIWDHLQNSGEGLGAEFGYFLPTVNGSVDGYRVEDRLTGQERWSARWAHWQSLSPRLSIQGRSNFVSDSQVNNLYVLDASQRVTQTAQSEVGAIYQSPRFSVQVSGAHDRVFNPSTGGFVRQRTLLPRLEARSSPLKIGPTETYASFSATVRNEYTRPSLSLGADPIDPERDLFLQTAETSAGLSRRILLGRRTTLEPSLGLSETWRSWRIDETGRRDRSGLSQGRGSGGVNWRWRVSDDWDTNVSYAYRVRWAPDALRRDTTGTDRGVESNGVATVLSYRPSLRFWARAQSGYDFRADEIATIHTPRQKITPPSLDLNWKPGGTWSVFAREVTSLYPTRRVQSATVGVSAGDRNRRYVASSVSYTSGLPGRLSLSPEAAFPLTKGWWVRGQFQATATGPGGARYRALSVTEKTLRVERDLHCWKFRADLRQRPGVNEVFFRLELALSAAQRRLTAPPEEQQIYPDRQLE